MPTQVGLIMLIADFFQPPMTNHMWIYNLLMIEVHLRAASVSPSMGGIVLVIFLCCPRTSCEFLRSQKKLTKFTALALISKKLVALSNNQKPGATIIKFIKTCQQRLNTSSDPDPLIYDLFCNYMFSTFEICCFR